jgi:hypothetical protein
MEAIVNETGNLEKHSPHDIGMASRVAMWWQAINACKYLPFIVVCYPCYPSRELKFKMKTPCEDTNRKGHDITIPLQIVFPGLFCQRGDNVSAATTTQFMPTANLLQWHFILTRVSRHNTFESCITFR